MFDSQAKFVLGLIRPLIDRADEIKELNSNDPVEPIGFIQLPMGSYPSLLLEREPQIKIDLNDGVSFLERPSWWRRWFLGKTQRVERKGLSNDEILHYLRRISIAYPYPITIAYRPWPENEHGKEDWRYFQLDLGELLSTSIHKVQLMPDYEEPLHV